MRVVPENWKRLIFHTGTSKNRRGILENGIWAGGISSRGGRQASFFSALKPQDPDSRWDTCNYQRPANQPRKVLYNHSRRPNHDCIYHLIVEIAQLQKQTFFQSSTDAINVSGFTSTLAMTSLPRSGTTSISVEKFDIVRREVDFMWNMLLGAIFLDGVHPDNFPQGIVFMFVFSDTECWNKRSMRVFFF